MSELASIPTPAPGSCSPRALGRLLGFVAAGASGVEALARRMRTDPAAARRHLEVAAWLGFLTRPSTATELEIPPLSRRGLEFVFGARRRPRVYAEALWDHPLMGPLMAHKPGRALDRWELEELLRGVAPAAEPPQLEHAVAAVHAFMAPAIRQRPRRRERRPGAQLRLAFARPRAPVTGYRLRAADIGDSTLEDPALYRSVLQLLLDEGELAIPDIAGLLSDLGAPSAPAGAYAQMAVRRGDAVRHHDGHVDKLVVTAGGVERRDVSDTVASVALSDPDYRDYLHVLQATGQGALGAAARYGRLRARFRRWDERVFGVDVSPRAMAHAAHRLIEGPTLVAIPQAKPGVEVDYLSQPALFLDQLDSSNLVVALPASIELLVGGLPAVNRALDRGRGSAGWGHPAFAPRLRVHGGLCHPGEQRPGAIPDGVSLRLHVIERVPHLAVLVATLLQQRVSRGRVGVRLRGDRLRVYHRRRDLGSFLLRSDDLMRERGWLVSRRQRGGLPEATLKDLAEVLGIAVQAGRALVLRESFFRRLLHQPEDRHVHDRLQPLGVWIESRLAEWAVGVQD